MKEKEKKFIINKTLTILRKVLSEKYCIGYNIEGDAYIDPKVIIGQFHRELEEGL